MTTNDKCWNVVKTALQLLTLLILFLAGLHLLVAAIEKETAEGLTRAQREEVMSRQYSDLEREDHVDMASRILAARVERGWRER